MDAVARMSEAGERTIVEGSLRGEGGPVDATVFNLKACGGSGRNLRRFRMRTDTSLVATARAMITVCSPASASPADEAMKSPTIVGKLSEFRQACSDEKIDATPTAVEVGPGATGVVVKLTSSKGQCFGQPGENDYLLIHDASGGRSVLAAEPGSIKVGRPGAGGFATVTLFGLGLCRITYRRVGAAYRARASKECHGLGGSPSLLDVTRAIQD